MKPKNLFPSVVQLLLVLSLSIFSNLFAEEPVGKSKETAMKPGVIVLTAFKGDVKITRVIEGKEIKPSQGIILMQGDIVLTGANSNASLAFENGTVIQVQGGSKFMIQEFQQSPWDVTEEKLAETKSEPSNSKTVGYVEYGDIVSGVKKLKPGSSMDICTPMGTAGIRGTEFRVNAQRNSDGSSKRFVVSVASGEIAVTSKGGGNPASVKGGTSSTVSTGPTESGVAPTIQEPVISNLSPQDSAKIQQTVQNQRSQGESVFSQAVIKASKEADKGESKLNSDQKKTLEKAAAQGSEELVKVAQNLTAEIPAAAPEIAEFAAGKIPSFASEIAAAIANIAPEMAPAIASAVSTVVPAAATQVAASVATAVPAAATQIAVAVSATIPSFASQVASAVAKVVPASASSIAAGVASIAPSNAATIASSVAMQVPDAAADIARSVAQTQPQLASQIANSIVQNVPSADVAGVGDSAKAGAQQASQTGIGNDSPKPANTAKNDTPPPPAPTPQPTPSPEPTPTPTPSPEPTPTPTPSPTPTPTPSPTPTPTPPISPL